jgi:hypothetical protein
MGDEDLELLFRITCWSVIRRFIRTSEASKKYGNEFCQEKKSRKKIFLKQGLWFSLSNFSSESLYFVKNLGYKSNITLWLSFWVRQLVVKWKPQDCDLEEWKWVIREDHLWSLPFAQYFCSRLIHSRLLVIDWQTPYAHFAYHLLTQ